MGKGLFFNIYYAIIPLLIIGMSLGYTTFLVALIAFVPLLFLTTRHTVGFFLIMYGGPLAGVIRAMYPALPVYGILFQIIGFVLIRDLVVDLISNHSKAFLWMFFILVLFGLFYLIGPMDEWANNKYLKMCFNGTMMIFGYYVLDKSDKIDAEGLTRLLFMAALCMFEYLIETYRLVPGHLFDYNWFRDQLSIWDNENRGYARMLITYQHIGMLIAFAIAIYLSKVKLNGPLSLFYVIIGAQLVMISGCRQAILAIAVVLVLRFAVFKNPDQQRVQPIGRLFGMLFGLALSLIALLLFFQNVQSDIISRTLAEGDVGRQMHFMEAIAIFKDSPLVGAGIGGYHSITGNAWPHNFFLELLSETGLIGTLALLAIILGVLTHKRIKLTYITQSDMFFFLVLVALFVRVMVSSDLPESIELFSAVFAISATNSSLPVVSYSSQIGQYE